MKVNLTTGADLIGSWLADVETGKPPAKYTLAAPFDSMDVRPGRLILLGGPPGTGKTAALLQAGVDLLRLNDSARVIVANVEMPAELLLERIVSRMSGVPLTLIADRKLTTDDLTRIQAVVDALKLIAGRLAFLGPPFSLEHVAHAADEFRANVLILDYLQRFTVETDSKDKREQLDTAVTVLRRFCHDGAVVLGASAVARQKGPNGSTYEGLTLASFRGSSEIEFGVDACYLLNAEADGPDVTFACAKNRYGPLADILTTFDPNFQTFAAAVELSPLERFDAVAPAPARKFPKPKGDGPCDN